MIKCNYLQSILAGEIRGDSCGRIGLGETPQRRSREEALQPPTESEVYFPRGFDAVHKVLSYRAVSINSLGSMPGENNNLSEKQSFFLIRILIKINNSIDVYTLHADIKKRKSGVFMGKQSISEIKTLFLEDRITETDIALLKNDTRKGVQLLITTYEKNKLKKQAQEMAFYEMCTYERNAKAAGKQLIAGIDEAGRGPLAGPVVAAAVILPEDFMLLGLNDSKQISESKRDEFYDIIKENAVSFGISIMDSRTIDRVNIFEATKLAMKDALSKLYPQADHVLIDAVRLDNLTCSSEPIIKGDAKSVSIAAASILAKVTRDRLMKKIHEEYPIYDFQSNMGYGTKFHLDKLKEFGISPYHRKSFAPVKENM